MCSWRGGLFPGGNDTPFTGVINVYSYEGNNAEDISDFEAAPATLVGSFSTAGLSVGDTLSFDISAQYNAAITADWDSLGIRLQVDTGSPAGNTGGSQAYTFDSFRLTSTDESSSPVPDSGSTLHLFGLMLPVAGFFKKRLAKIGIASR